jgi:glycosyltransferase involved in cell wall biosynthesis
MRYFRNSRSLLLDEVLGRVARIESTVNFIYDNLEFLGQNLNVFELQKELILARNTREFRNVFKKKSPKISVIIPISRPTKIVEKALLSVVTQTYVNIEIILVAEKLRSDIKKLILKLNDSRIKLLINEKQTSVTGSWSKWATSGAESRSLGMLNAKGDFFTFLDDDDLMQPNKIEMCLNFARDFEYELVGHMDGVSRNGDLVPLRTNKIGKTRNYLGGSVDYLGLGTNVLLIHNFFLKVKWPSYNYKNLKGNDTVFIRMLFELNPKFGFLPEILTIKN